MRAVQSQFSVGRLTGSRRRTRRGGPDLACAYGCRLNDRGHINVTLDKQR